MAERRYTADYYNILLAQVLRSPAIAELAFNQLEGSYFTNKDVGGTPSQGVVFNVVKTYYETYKTVPDFATLATHVNDYVTSRVTNTTIAAKIKEDLRLFMSFAAHVDERSERHARDIVAYVAEICVFKPTASKILSEATCSGAISGVADKLYELEGKKAMLAGGLAVSGLSGFKSENIGDRVSTNIPWLDSYFGDGKGPVRGSVMGIIAPQGGGKTTMGIQLGVSQALAHNYSLLVLAEEGLTLPVQSKIFACALGLPFSDIQEAEGSCIGDKLRSLVEAGRVNREMAIKKVAAIDQYLHVLNLLETPDVDELGAIRGQLHTMKLRGTAPVYVYVDWAGIIADNMVAKSGESVNKVTALKRISYELTKQAQENNAIIAISQQMKPAIAQKGPFHTPDFTCAADCSGFTEPHKYVIAINGRDPKTSYQLMTFVKARDDGLLGTRVVVKLRGDLVRFEDLSDQYRVAGKRFARLDGSSSAGKVPSEAKARSGEEVE